MSEVLKVDVVTFIYFRLLWQLLTLNIATFKTDCNEQLFGNI